MARRGTENRQKMHSVLVRMTGAQYRVISDRAVLEGCSRAECVRRNIGKQGIASNPDQSDTGMIAGMPDGDRAIIAAAARSMGHLAGLMKRATFEIPTLGRGSEITRILTQHHADLQVLQNQLRKIMEKFS